MLLFHTLQWQRACMREMMQRPNLNTVPGIMGTATQELRAAIPGSSLRKSKEKCFKNEHLEYVRAFQKLRKHCISCLLKIVVKIPMTYCLKNFLYLSLSEVCILCPTLDIKQLPEGSFILSHQSIRTTVFFPSRMEDLFFMQGIPITKHLLYFRYTNN